MKYYRIKPDLFNKQWAYGMIYSNCANYDHENKEAYCPLCHRPVAPSKWKGPYKIYLSSKRIPDIVFGACPMLVNEKVKDAFLESGLNGINAFREVEVFFRGKNVHPSFYFIELNYSQKKIPLAKQYNEMRKTDKTLPRCSLCKRGNNTSSHFRELYFDNQKEFDIFRIYETPGEIYCTQKFYDFCKENHFTNIIEWMEEIPEN